MFKDEYRPLIYLAWLKLLFAYLISFVLSFTFGLLLIKIFKIAPEIIFEISTKRVSYVFPLLETGEALGVDRGILLFIWNLLGALATIAFLYTAPLFNPEKISQFPRILRKMLCGSKRMKLLCFLPGCMRIDEEYLRRLYVWLMVPWLGMILLGIESGLTVSTSSYIFGSYLIGFASLIPHGIIEIPTICYAGTITFSAHLMVKEKIKRSITARIFDNIDDYIETTPLLKIIFLVILFLMIAGLIEGHVTFRIIDFLMAK